MEIALTWVLKSTINRNSHAKKPPFGATMLSATPTNRSERSLPARRPLWSQVFWLDGARTAMPSPRLHLLCAIALFLHSGNMWVFRHLGSIHCLIWIYYFLICIWVTALTFAAAPFLTLFRITPWLTCGISAIWYSVSLLLPVCILISHCSYCPYIDAIPNSSPSTTAVNTCSHIINFMCLNSSRISLLSCSTVACWTLMDKLKNLQNSFKDVIWRILHPDSLAASQTSHFNL